MIELNEVDAACQEYRINYKLWNIFQDDESAEALNASVQRLRRAVRGCQR